MDKVSLMSLPDASTAIMSGVTTTFDGGSLELRFDVDREGDLASVAVRFYGVRALAYVAEEHCTLWHIEGAYDTIAEVIGSEWVQDLISARPEFASGLVMRHLMIYLDGEGCYEAVAETWELLEGAAII